MSCYKCAEKFGFFKKEKGCGNCGFSFCSKCCDQKINVPKKNNQVLNVCQKCYDLIQNDADKKSNLTKNISPPKNFLKMVESNKSKLEPNPDKHLEDRLEKLKKTDKPSVPDTEELQKRLEKLQDKSDGFRNLSNLPSKEVIKTPDDLISKLTEEVKLDKDYEEYEKRELEKLENRLKNLKSGLDLEKKEEDKKDTAICKDLEYVPRKMTDPKDELMKKLLEEAEFSIKCKNKEDEDEWCCLCNNDACLKCIDCEDDLYCKRCYKQTHSSGEYKSHRKMEIKSC